MHQGWLILLITSGALLAIVLIRSRIDYRWFGFALLHLVLAAVGLFIMNGTGWAGNFSIPINFYTLFTIMILGIPGLILLIAIKLTLI
jgi:inhibitor of the pro-sigma K processing machinery